MFKIVKGDLFNANPEYMLAHCVSRDFAMSGGIARTFVNKYPQMQSDLMCNEASVEMNQEQTLGVWNGKVLVANLITKEYVFEKPTYESLTKSLIALNEYARLNEIKKLAMPKIGCGIDELSWQKVATIINEKLTNFDDILVYEL